MLFIRIANMYSHEGQAPRMACTAVKSNHSRTKEAMITIMYTFYSLSFFK